MNRLSPAFALPHRMTERFELRRLLGSGGFGDVFEAFDRERGERVALKTLHRTDAGSLFRFKREFRTLAGFAHPNLVVLHELFADDATCFFTMELVDGVSFVDFVREGPNAHDASLGVAPTLEITEIDAIQAAVTRSASFPSSVPKTALASPPARLSSDRIAPSVNALPCDLGRLRSSLRQLADALGALHAAGIVHRDIKPSNVLVGSTGRVVLVDFGLAAELSGPVAHSTQAIVGTPAYMAPEQSYDAPVGPASDWYAVGTLLFEALTRRLPFDGDAVGMLFAKRSRDGAAPSSVVAGVPADLDGICARLLLRDPAARARGADLREVLGAVDVAIDPTAAIASARSDTHDVFVGREAAKRALSAALARASEGAAQVVTLRGPSGMGKSALLRHVARAWHASDDGAVVLFGRCYQEESVPFKGVDGLVDALSRYLVSIGPAADGLLPRDVTALRRLFPVFGQVPAATRGRAQQPVDDDARSTRKRAFAALRELLVRLADRRPLALLLDDAQWGDADSASVLAEVMAPPRGPALVLVLAYRSGDAAGEMLGQLLPALSGAAADDLHVTDVELAPLSLEESVALVDATLESARGSQLVARAIAHDAAGLPIFVSELAHAARARSATLEHETAEIRSVDALLHARIDELPVAAREVLELLAIAAHPLSLTVLLDAAHLAAGAPAVLRTLRLLRLAKTHPDGRAEIYHDRVREVAFGALPAEAREQRAARLLGALVRANVQEDELLARMASLSGDRASAAQHAARAARHALAAFGLERAARLFDWSLKLGLPTEADEDAAREALAGVLTHLGRGPEAAALLMQVASRATPIRAAELQGRAGEQLLMSGQITEGMSTLGDALVTLHLRIPRSPVRVVLAILALRLFVLPFYVHLRRFRTLPNDAVSDRARLRADTCWALSSGLVLVMPTHAALFAMRYVPLAIATGDPTRVFKGLLLLATMVAVSGGRRPSTLETAARAWARDLGARLDLKDRELHLSYSTANAHFLRGEWADAAEAFAKARTAFAESRAAYSWELAPLEVLRLHALFRLGRWGELREHARAVLDDARARGDRLVETSIETGLAYAGHLLDDDPDGARKVTEDALARWSQSGFQLQHAYRLQAIVNVTLYEEAGAGSGAQREIDAHWRPLARSLIMASEVMRVLMLETKARAELAASADRKRSRGERVAALAAAERVADQLTSIGSAHAAQLVPAIRFAIADARGNDGDARTWGEAAVRQFTRAGMAAFEVAMGARLAALTTDGEAREHAMRDAHAWLAARGAKEPARVVAMLLPGRRGSVLAD